MKILNVSRATLREAFWVVVKGIVTITPRKGIRTDDPAQTNGYLLRPICRYLKKSAALSYSRPVFAKADYDFHMQIAHCSENRLGVKLMQTMGLMLQEQLTEGVRNYPQEKRTLIVQSHAVILHAIERRDQHEARRCMLEHLERPDQTIRQAEASCYFANRQRISNL